MLNELLLFRIIRTGLRRGLNGGHWGWYALAACATLLRYVNRQDVAAVSQLRAKPGERLLVTVHEPAPRRRRLAS